MGKFFNKNQDQSDTPEARYVPVHFEPGQIGKESGHRQFDSKGKPLTSPKGATGIAQVMESTGPEAAAAAGLPWDRDRWLNDENYNLQIGDAYMGKMKARYGGDKTKAMAAYNAGPGRVDKAIARGGVNWQSHLPDETRRYIGMPSSLKTSDQQPTSQFAGNAGPAPSRGAPVADPATQGAKAKDQATQVGKASDVLGNVFAAISPQMQENSDQALQDTKDQIAAKTVILDQVKSNAEMAKTALFPLFAKKEAIFKRMEEVDRMDPVSRALAGLFNRNYNKQHLQEQLNLTDAHANSLSQDLSRATAVQDVILKATNESFSDKQNLHEMIAKNLVQRLSLAQDSLQIANAQMSSTMGVMSANSATVTALENQRQDALGQIMDAPTVTNLLGQAKANPDGQVMVGGVKLSQADLMDRGIKLEQQGLQLKQLRLAIQAGDIQLQKMNEERLLDSMTADERMKLAQNGGRLADGTVISSDVMQAALAKDSAITAAAVNGAQLHTYGASAVDAARSWSTNFKMTTTRMAGVFGSAQTQGLARQGVAQSQEIERMVRQVGTMPEGPAKDALRADITKRASEFQAQNQKTVDDLITRASPDKDVQGLYRAFITGTPITPDAAVKGFISATRASTPIPGSLNRDDYAFGTIQAMQQAVATVTQKYGGADGLKARLMNKATGPQIEQELQQAVTTEATRTWTNQMGNRVLSMLPEWAKADRHLAGNFQNGQIGAAQKLGDQRGLESSVGAAQQLIGHAVTPAQLKALINGQPVQGIPMPNPTVLKQLRSAVSNAQTQEMMRVLDKDWVVGKGPRPSKILADYMGTQGFLHRVQAVESSVSHTGLPATIVSGINGEGTLSATIGGYARNFAMASANNDENERRDAMLTYKAYRGDPFRRTGAIIAGIPDLDPVSERKVIQFIRSQTQTGQGMGMGQYITNLASNPGAMMGIGSSQDDPIYEQQIMPQINNLVLNQKWPDDLEPLRKKIAPKWNELSRTIDAAMDRLERENN